MQRQPLAIRLSHQAECAFLQQQSCPLMFISGRHRLTPRMTLNLFCSASNPLLNLDFAVEGGDASGPEISPSDISSWNRSTSTSRYSGANPCNAADTCDPSSRLVISSSAFVAF